MVGQERPRASWNTPDKIGKRRVERSAPIGPTLPPTSLRAARAAAPSQRRSASGCHRRLRGPAGAFPARAPARIRRDGQRPDPGRPIRSSHRPEPGQQGLGKSTPWRRPNDRNPDRIRERHHHYRRGVVFEPRWQGSDLHHQRRKWRRPHLHNQRERGGMGLAPTARQWCRVRSREGGRRSGHGRDLHRCRGIPGR